MKKNASIALVSFLCGIGVAYLCQTFVLPAKVYSYDLGFEERISGAFHSNNPTYGLPFIEYCTVLELLSEERPDAAKHRLESFLDLAALDARERLNIENLGKEEENQIRRALIKMIEWRELHPRALPKKNSQGVYLDRQRLKEVDAFLDDAIRD